MATPEKKLACDPAPAAATKIDLRRAEGPGADEDLAQLAKAVGHPARVRPHPGHPFPGWHRAPSSSFAWFCPVFLGKALRIHWGLPDPGGRGATEEERLRASREVRDELRRRIQAAIAP